MLDDLIKQTWEDISKVKEPKAQALLETSAEVLPSRKKAFNDYEEGTGSAWERT